MGIQQNIAVKTRRDGFGRAASAVKVGCAIPF